MEALFISSITQLCFLLNSLRILSYLPQIITIVKGKDDSKSISVLTWSFWTFTNFVTVLYTTFVHFDYILILTNVGNTLGCGIVVFLVLYKRRKYKKVNEKVDFSHDGLVLNKIKYNKLVS